LIHAAEMKNTNAFRRGAYLDTATGARPSPGAATFTIGRASKYSKPGGFSRVAAPGDGRAPVLALLLMGALLSHCLGDDLAEKGKAIFKKNQHAVVTVELVLKNKFSMSGMAGQANESRQDATGTVVDPSGLTVMSLSATDPAQLFQNLMSAASDEDNRFKMETELSDLKILLDDGTEIPAEVILRDKDLDLAFIRPKAKVSSPMTALDLAGTGKAEILDQIITLNRLGSAAGRAYSASIDRISAIVQRPRLFYVPDSSFNTAALGAPAFTLDGKVLGIFVMRSMKNKSGGGLGLFSFQADNMTGVIVPAEDVLKGMKQVPGVAEEKTSK
jgi:hypothetical protein